MASAKPSTAAAVSPEAPSREQMNLLAKRQKALAARLQATAEALRARAEVVRIEADLFASGFFVDHADCW